MMTSSIIIFVCVAVIAMLESANLISGKDLINRRVKFWLVLLSLGLIVYFTIEEVNINGSETVRKRKDRQS